MKKNVITFIILLIIGIALFVLGGWDMGKLTFFGLGTKQVVIDTIKNASDFKSMCVIAIRINDSYYGLATTARFFDSPALSWILLWSSGGFIAYGISALFD